MNWSDVLGIAVLVGIALLCLVPIATELITRAVVRGIYEERSAVNRRLYQKESEKDGE